MTNKDMVGNTQSQVRGRENTEKNPGPDASIKPTELPEKVKLVLDKLDSDSERIGPISNRKMSMLTGIGYETLYRSGFGPDGVFDLFVEGAWWETGEGLYVDQEKFLTWYENWDGDFDGI